MPFTLSHAAAALPLRRLKLITSALVIGTFAPDFEYFLYLSPHGKYGHTLPGVFFLTLPLALITLWLFHAFVKLPVVELFPSGVERRLSKQLVEFRFFGAARFALIVISTLTGIATHLVWDSFTHSDTWLYHGGPFLQQSVEVFFAGDIPVYKVLQYTSTVIGMAALAIWLLLWYRNTRPYSEAENIWPRWKGLILGGIAAIATAGATIRVMIALRTSANVHSGRVLGIYAATLIPLLWWQLVFYGIWRSRILSVNSKLET